jgi:hypothetical protein
LKKLRNLSLSRRRGPWRFQSWVKDFFFFRAHQLMPWMHLRLRLIVQP